MERKVHAKHVRIAPRKARIVMNFVKGKTAGEALEMLRFVNKSAARPIAKMIESAVEDVRRKDPTLNVDDLVISGGWVDQGPAMKRRRPRARGYATLIKKYFSHLNLVLSDEK
jgi:large subunit ribosomal protein L22